MIVYVITKGCYSDYHICGVTFDKDRAEKLVKFYSDGYDDAEIEEYDTEAEDGALLERLTPVYQVDIAPNGEYTVSIWKYVDGQEGFKTTFIFPNAHATGTESMRFRARLLAKDAPHAAKIACDERAKRIAFSLGL